MTRITFVSTTMIFVVVCAGCCQQSDYKELRSPDNRYVVIEKEDNCGATDPFGTEISIRSRRPRLGIRWLGFSSRRIFLADVRLGNTRVRWLDDQNIEVACTDCERYGIAERVNEWRGIRIHFDVGKATRGQY